MRDAILLPASSVRAISVVYGSRGAESGGIPPGRAVFGAGGVEKGSITLTPDRVVLQPWHAFAATDVTHPPAGTLGPPAPVPRARTGGGRHVDRPWGSLSKSDAS